MAGIRSRDTTPEKIVRSHLHRAGLRFRLHDKHLPGTPDIVLPKWKAAVFVHGCFWHRHPGCRFASTPSTNVRFWRKKFRENVARDQKKIQSVRRSGWRTFVVWECRLESRQLDRLVARVRLPGCNLPMHSTGRY